MTAGSARRDVMIRGEADFFNRHDNELTRQVAWSAIPLFQRRINQAFNFSAKLTGLLAGRCQLACLSLACGNMKGEYSLLKKIGAASIDAFDISEEQRRKFFAETFDGSVEVDYRIEDVNAIELPEHRYDVVYVQHALHHLEAVEHVARQVNRSLKADGLFVLTDYVGAPYLQRTPRQRALARRIWPLLPARYRTNIRGQVLEDIHIPAKESLPPCEAIRSDAILPSLERYLTPVDVFLYGGLLFPLFNGFARCYTDSAADQRFLQLMWEVDRMLIEANAVEPNFVRGIYRRK